MQIEMTTSEFNEFCAKVDILESKGYNLTFNVDRNQKGNFNVELIGDHDPDHLDSLTES